MEEFFNDILDVFVFWEIEMVMINCEKQIGLLLHSYPIL